jgi:hypothetical protein
MNRKANNVLSPNLLSNLKKMNSYRYLKASQRELDEILIGISTHSQDEMPLFGVFWLPLICWSPFATSCDHFCDHITTRIVLSYKWT